MIGLFECFGEEHLTCLLDETFKNTSIVLKK